jgi:hypothetical protein
MPAGAFLDDRGHGPRQKTERFVLPRALSARLERPAGVPSIANRKPDDCADVAAISLAALDHYRAVAGSVVRSH